MHNHPTGSGQESWNGSAQKDKNDDYPNGLACEFVDKATKGSKPSDASAMVEMDVELNQLRFKASRDFNIDKNGILDKYEVTKSNCEMCIRIMRLRMPG